MKQVSTVGERCDLLLARSRSRHESSIGRPWHPRSRTSGHLAAARTRSGFCSGPAASESSSRRSRGCAGDKPEARSAPNETSRRGCLSGFAATDAHHHFVTDGIVSPETEGVTFRGLLDM